MIRIGACSWTEKTLVKSGEFYPKGVRSAEERFRYYSERFDTVEVDSSYYAIPDKANAALWAHRSPDGFVFHVKAYGALTGHAIDPATLPGDIRKELTPEQREGKRLYVKEPSLLKTISERYIDALAPLKASGKLGIIVFQFPPWFQLKKENCNFILKCKELMRDLDVGVEFRHGSWLAEDRREDVLSFLHESGLTYISADEPQYGSLATIPFLPDATSDIAYIRFHGRNKDNWLRKGVETSLRFAYEYSENELREFAPLIKRLDGKVKKTYAMFNNCHGGFAVRNASRMKQILSEQH